METLELTKKIEDLPEKNIAIPVELLIRTEKVRAKLYFDSRESTLRYLLNNALLLEGV